MEGEHNDDAETSKLLNPLEIYEEVDESEIGHFVNEDITGRGHDESKSVITYKRTEDTFDVRVTLSPSLRDRVYKIYCCKCVNHFLQVLLKELEEFAFKGIPDVRGCKVQDAQILEEMVRQMTRVTRQQTLRSLSVSYQKKDPSFGVTTTKTLRSVFS